MIQRAWRRVPEGAQDLLLALFITVMQVQGVLVRGPDVGERPITDLSGLGVVLLVVPGLALAARRRRPVPVLVVAAVSSAVYFSLEFSDGPGWLALFVSLYTVAAYGDGRRSLRLAGATVAVLAAVWVYAARDIQPHQAIGWVFFRIGASVMSTALGESIRARKVIATDAVARAELAERTRDEEARARVADERVRIAREVHDTVAHAIAIINVQAGVTAHVLDRKPEQARGTLVAIEQTSARALEEMRMILGVLRAEADVDSRSPLPGLADVDELLDRAREAGLEVRRDHSPMPPVSLPSAVATAAYRIVQESITNVIRHVGPTLVTVGVDLRHDALEVSVADAGRQDQAAGLPFADRQHPGHGIRGMRERCELLGGRLDAGPLPGAGFEVRAQLPLTLSDGSPA